MFNGLLLSIEGPDTAGKSTQAKNLKNILTDKGYLATILHFPCYEGIIGNFIKSIITTDLVNKIDNKALQYLYIADQIDNNNVINKYLERGYIVILDRYDLSTLIYSLSKLKMNILDTMYDYEVDNTAKRIYDAQSFLKKPDVSFILNLDHEEISKRKDDLDGMESDIERMCNVSKLYKNIDNHIYDNRKVFHIDATKATENITDEIFKKLKSIGFEDYISREYTN